MPLAVEELGLQADRVDHHFLVARLVEHVAHARAARRVVAVGEDQHDLAALDVVQHVDARVDRVVQARRVAELQILERADQVVAVVGERAAELNLVAERADLPLVVRAACGG